MNRILILFSFLLLPFTQGMAAVRLELSPNSITMDNTATLTLIVEGGLQRRPPAIPLPDDLRVVGNSFQTVTASGKTEARIVYEIQATKPGRYEIGPYQLEMKDGKHNLPKKVLTVKPATVVQATDDVFVIMEASNTSALVRQSIQVSITFYSVHSIERIQLDDLNTENFDAGDWQEVNAPSRVIDGQRYKVRRIINQLTPQKAGSYTLNPTLLVQLAVPQDLKRDPSFGMFTRRFSLRNVRIQPQSPLTLTIEAPPEKGKPHNFAGHIGQFALNASISPSEVNVGDPITLKVQLSGSGTIQEALPPKIEENEDFKVYEPRLINENIQRNGRSGSKSLEQVLIPQHDGISEVPALEFSYYDPNLKKYITTEIGPFPITVTGTLSSIENPGVINSLGAAGLTPETSPTMLGQDLVYLKTQPGRIRALSTLIPGLRFTLSSSAPFLLWALVAFGSFLRHPDRRNPDDTRRRNAPKLLRDQLQLLDGIDDGVQELYSGIWTGLSVYLRDQLQLPPGELESTNVLERLPATVSTETQSELSDWMSRCERARFGASEADSDLPELRESFKSFVLKLDKEVRA